MVFIPILSIHIGNHNPQTYPINDNLLSQQTRNLYVGQWRFHTSVISFCMIYDTANETYNQKTYNIITFWLSL